MQPAIDPSQLIASAEKARKRMRAFFCVMQGFLTPTWGLSASSTTSYLGGEGMQADRHESASMPHVMQ